jgi:hypothetical protein
LAEQELNNNSSGKKDSTSLSLSLTLFLFCVLALFGFVLFFYWNVVVGVLFIVIPTAYYIIKKYISTRPVDELIKNLFGSKKSVLVFSITLVLFSIAIIAVNEIDIFPKNQMIRNNKFGGVVWDNESEPLSKVVIIIPELNLIDTTDNQGKFLFNDLDTSYSTIAVIATKVGYHTYEGEGSIGNSNFNFILRKK